MSTHQMQYIDFWENKITKDLSPFCDPGTILNVNKDGRAIVCRWTQRFQEHTAEFTIDIANGVKVSFANQELSYRSFISSPSISDLRSLAKMILQYQKGGIFIEPIGFLDDDSDKSGPAITILKNKANQSDLIATSVIMITGDAGAGKTSMLQRLVHSFADSFVKGETDKLLLYVNAQGRALARFNEALATELQELRSTLTYHAISTLVRNNLIIPVIDGFDELLGVSGYDDAFSSLSTFIEELDGNGTLIASARSSYYENEFVSRANRTSSLGSHTWKQSVFHLNTWREEEVNGYIREYAIENKIGQTDLDHIKATTSKIFSGKNESLKTKPLFLTKIIDLINDGHEISNSDDLLSEIVNIYVDRECRNKLLDRSGMPLISASDLLSLLKSVSEEMWNLETRELNKNSIREIAEYAIFEADLPARTKEILVERLPTMAFLSVGSIQGSIQFEHEIFFGYFLSKKMSEMLLSEVSTISRSMIMGRSILPVEVLDIMVKDLKKEIGSNDSLGLILEKICNAAMQKVPRKPLVKENCGNLASHILSDLGYQIIGHTIQGLTFSNTTLRNANFNNVCFKDTEFRRVDLTTTKYLSCKSIDSMFYEITVNPEITVIELAGWDIETQLLGIKLNSDSDYSFDPSDVMAILSRISRGLKSNADGLESRRKIPSEVKHVMERFVKAYKKSNPICIADDTLRGIFGYSDWPKLQSLLIRHRVVTIENRHTGGPAKEFLRRQVLPDEILNGLNKNAIVPLCVKQFWDAVEDKFKT